MPRIPAAEAAERSATVRTYEVRVQGRLSRAVVGYLGWSSRTEPGQCCIRVLARPTELAALLRSCVAGGLIVDRITRLGHGPAGLASADDPGVGAVDHGL